MKEREVYRRRFADQRCCLVIPTYNNAEALAGVLTEALDYCADVFVVNDGSTDETARVLEGISGLQLISFSRNRGKGKALQRGFREALERGFDYAITLDSDGQHRPGDLPLFLEALEEGGDMLVVGSRRLDHQNVPGKNRFANRLSSFWFRVETGLRIHDTQSGYRLYPIRRLERKRFISGRYEYELEVLVKTAWKGILLREVPINVIYAPRGERVTHFRPFRDFMRITLLNFLLVFLGLAYYRPRLMYRRYRNKSIRQIFREDIVRSDMPRYMIALSIAFGIFMGIFPIWGYQLVVGFFFAHLFRLNKAIFFIAANISIPPMIPFVLYLSYVAGSYVLGDGSWTVDVELNLVSIGENLKQYLTGAVVFALIAGVVSGIISYALLLLFKRK